MEAEGKKEHVDDVLPVDPRIRRSRQMLHDALFRLLAQKEFEKISIQEITEAACLNRATFYDHYPDKASLLRCMVGSRFQGLLDRRNVRFTCAEALRALILGVCDYLVDMPTTPCRSHSLPPSMQSAVISIVRAHLVQGLHHHHADLFAQQPAKGDLVASAAAWSIYGAATEWVKTPGRPPAEQIDEEIERFVSPILESVAR